MLTYKNRDMYDRNRMTLMLPQIYNKITPPPPPHKKSS